MEHDNLQIFHGEVNDLIGYWKSEIEKFKFTRDANEQDSNVSTNTTITATTARDEIIPPSSNTSINISLEKDNIQISQPSTVHLDYQITTVDKKQTAVDVPVNTNKNLDNNNNSRDRTDDSIVALSSQNVAEVYHNSIDDSNDSNPNNLPLDIDTLEEVYMNVMNNDLDTEFLSFQESSSQYAYRDDETEEGALHPYSVTSSYFRYLLFLSLFLLLLLLLIDRASTTVTS